MEQILWGLRGGMLAQAAKVVRLINTKDLIFIPYWTPLRKMLFEMSAMVNVLTDYVERAYRKPLGCKGLIYLGLEEHRFKIINLSLTGLLVEFDEDAPLNDVRSIFESLRISPLVDIYLPEMRVAGEGEVVRAEPTEKGIQIAVEFRNLSYDVEHLLYTRRAYRKNMTAPGQIIVNEVAHAFNTENVSVDGIMAHILEKIEIETGQIVHFSFSHLELQGEGEVMWVEQNSDSTLLGLKYIRLERDIIPGIPHFVRRDQDSD